MIITKQTWIGFFVGVVIALAVATLVVYRTNAVQRHVCESNLKVRAPLEDYIDTTIPLYRLSVKIQGEEAKLRSPPPEALAKLEAEMTRLQAANFHNLLDLRSALHSAVVTGCSE